MRKIMCGAAKVIQIFFCCRYISDVEQRHHSIKKNSTTAKKRNEPELIIQNLSVHWLKYGK